MLRLVIVAIPLVCGSVSILTRYSEAREGLVRPGIEARVGISLGCIYLSVLQLSVQVAVL
jgi:hypothetical protein